MPVAVPFPKIELHVRLEGTVRPPALLGKRSSLRTAIRERTILRTR